MTGVICVEKRDHITPVAVTAHCWGTEMVSTGREKSAMLARVMPHLKVGALKVGGKERGGGGEFWAPSPARLARSLPSPSSSSSHQKWIVCGPAGWFQNARARAATPAMSSLLLCVFSTHAKGGGRERPCGGRAGRADRGEEGGRALGKEGDVGLEGKRSLSPVSPARRSLARRNA